MSVENPLPRSEAVERGSIGKPDDWWSCDSPFIRLKELVPLSGNAEGSFEIEYRPLIVTKQPLEHLLTIMTKQLGTFKYKVIVNASPSVVRQTLKFEASLGSMQAETFVFKTFGKADDNLTCAVTDASVFDVPKTLACPGVSDWGGADSRLSIRFEPTQLGETRDLLTIGSAQTGQYECQLIGVCTPPVPLGPFNFTTGSNALEIPFRNCFNTTCKWNFMVDSVHFTIASASATVNAKTEGACSVTFRPVDNPSTDANDCVTGKLFIQCDSKPEVPPWVVYLRGKVLPGGADAVAQATKKK